MYVSYMYMYMYRVSWVRVPPEAALFSWEKGLPWVCCVALPCLLDLACFFLSSFSHLSLKHVIAESFIHVSYMEHVHVVMLLHFCPPLVVSVLSLHRLRSVSLFQSDRPYPFTLGQHQSLVHYLMTSCPLTLLQDQVTLWDDLTTFTIGTEFDAIYIILYMHVYIYMYDCICILHILVHVCVCMLYMYTVYDCM